ncbi:MAG: hypothetical protein WDL87_04300 [Candidatus Omnitrophota bacterium]|jgi:hypothetical protein
MKQLPILVLLFFMVLGVLVGDRSLQAQEPVRRTAAVAAQGKSVEAASFYQWLFDYTKPGEKEALVVVEFQDILILTGIDLLVSFVCVWLAFLFSIRIMAFDWKKFLVFFLNLNIGWFIVLLLFRGLWEIVSSLVIKLQPDLSGVFIQHFTIIILFVAVVFYLWLQARAFGLQFAESLKMFFISQCSYFMLVFLFFAFVSPWENRLVMAAQENLGIKPVIAAYVSDIEKVTSRRDLLSLARIRMFHL